MAKASSEALAAARALREAHPGVEVKAVASPGFGEPEVLEIRAPGLNGQTWSMQFEGFTGESSCCPVIEGAAPTKFPAAEDLIKSVADWLAAIEVRREAA